jgi:hypothetical protein
MEVSKLDKLKTEICLVMLFGVSLVANILMFGHFYGSMVETDRGLVLESMVKVHALPITALLAGIFASSHAGKRVSLAIVATAATVSVAWAILVSSSWWGFPDSIQAPEVSSRYLSYSADVSFLLVGMLAYMTGSGTKEVTS